MRATAKRGATNSRDNSPFKVLGALTVEDIKTFLTDSVNLPWSVTYPDHRDHFERWVMRWHRLFTYMTEVELSPQSAQPTLEEILNGEVDVDCENDSPANYAKRERVLVPRESLELFAPVVRTTLCRLWVEQDARQRDWYFYRLRDAHRQMVRHLEGWQEDGAVWDGAKTVQRLLDYALQDVPEVGPFEAAIYWLQLNHNLMLHCANPLCEAPFFLRQEKAKHQKHCSPECADPARRQAKLKWWNENRKTQGKKKAARRA